MNNIYIDVFLGITYDELFPLIKEIGFDGFFSGEIYANDFEKMSLFKHNAEQLGLRQETSHSTIPGSSSIWSSGTSGDEYIEVLKNNINNCSRLSIPILVVHIQPDFSLSPSFETGIKRLKTVVAYAKEKNVKLAFENINSAEYLYKTLDCFDDNHIGFCYDCGHEACHTNGEHFLPKIGDRLFCTHIHDNDNRSDLHLIPFDGDIDFERIARELRGCNYTGNLTLELCYNDFYSKNYSKSEYLKKCFASAVRLKNLISK